MRYVVKIGSSSLTRSDGSLAPERMLPYVSGLAQLHLAGHQVALVTSGAVAAGYKPAGFRERPQGIVEKQAAAAVGQSLLVQSYQQMFASYDLATAQVLLTADDLGSTVRRENAVATLNYLLRQPIIPIINENDTVAVEELTFGDNDRLSALVACELEADALVVLTDTPGLFDRNPHLYSDAAAIPLVPAWDDALLQLAEGGSGLGTGGMKSKLQAAAIMLQANRACFVGLVASPFDFLNIFSGRGAGTYFGATENIARAFSYPKAMTPIIKEVSSS